MTLVLPPPHSIPLHDTHAIPLPSSASSSAPDVDHHHHGLAHPHLLPFPPLPLQLAQPQAPAPQPHPQLVTVDGLFLDLATLTFAATVLSPTFPNLGLHFGEAPTGSTRTVSTTSSSDSGCGSGSGSDRSSSSANGSSSSGSGSSGNNSGTNNGSCAVVPSAPDPTFFLRLGERIGEGALWTVFAAEVVPINTQSQTQHASRNRNGPSPASPRTLPVVAKLTRASMHVEGLEWCETFARAEANLYAGPLGALGTVVPTFYGMWSAPLSGHDCMPVQQQMHQVQMQQGQDMDVVVCTSGAEDGPGIHDLPRDNPGHDPEDDCPALDPHLREDHSRGAGTGARNSNTLDACSYADSDAHDVLLVAVFERVGRPVARSWAEVPRDSRKRIRELYETVHGAGVVHGDLAVHHVRHRRDGSPDLCLIDFDRSCLGDTVRERSLITGLLADFGA